MAREARVAPDALDPAETLGFERRWVPKLGILAVLAGLFPLVGTIVQIIASQAGVPKDTQVYPAADAITRYANGESALVGRVAEQAQANGDHALYLGLGVVLTGIGVLCAGPVLFGVLRAAWRRRPAFPRAFLIMPFVGAVLLAVALPAQQIYGFSHLHDFATGPVAEQTNANAADAYQSVRDVSIVSYAVILGQLLFAVGIGSAGLSAMNVGLLTRFMGIIAVVLAVLVVLPLFDQQGFLRSFWFVALGFLLLGRWPGGRPPAWVSGDAMPWPSRAEMMEAAERQKQDRARAKEREEKAASQPAPKPKGEGGRRRKRK